MDFLHFLKLNKIDGYNIKYLIDENNIKYKIIKFDIDQLIISSNNCNWEILMSDDCNIINNSIISNDWERPNIYKIVNK